MIIKPSRVHSIVLTIYTLTITGIFLYEYSTWQQQPIIMDALTDTASTSQLIITGLFLAWLFLAGIIALIYYFFFTVRRPAVLKKKPWQFSLYYFIFMAWLAGYITIEVTAALLAPFAPSQLTPDIRLIISLALTAAGNIWGIGVMYHYLGAHKKFTTWIKTLLVPDQNTSIVKLIRWGILGYIGFFPLFFAGTVISTIALGLTGYDFPPQPLITFSLQNESIIISLLIFIAVAFATPFFEETIMRGLFFHGLYSRFKTPAAILVSGIIFGAFHFNLFAFLPITMMGMLFSWLYLKTKSLIPSIVAHGLFNAINFIMLMTLR